MNVAVLISVLALAVQGCSSEEEKIKQAQIDTCRTDIKSGKEPTQFCVNLLPEYKSVAQVNVPTDYPQNVQQPYPEQQYQQQAQPSQPQVVYQQAPVGQAPVIVQSAPQSSGAGDAIQNMAIGAMAGHLLSNNSNNGGSGYNNYNDRRPVTNVTRNVTIINKTTGVPLPPKSAQSAPVVTPSAPKPNYMDTSKFGSVGLTKPSAPVSKPSGGMNMGALSSFGSRPSSGSKPINLRKR